MKLRLVEILLFHHKDNLVKLDDLKLAKGVCSWPIFFWRYEESVLSNNDNAYAKNLSYIVYTFDNSY